jgi:hypothetical protein
LDFLWPLVDFPQPIVTAATVESWPGDVHQQLLAHGLLVQADNADRVLCPECRDHEEEVVVRTSADGRPRFFIACPRQLRVEISPTALRRWQVAPLSVASTLAKTLKLTGRCTELLAGRLWRMGRSAWKDSTRDMFFARGLNWDDATVVRALIVQGRNPIVFVAMSAPPEEFWQRRPKPVLALSRLATLVDHGIEVERLEIVAAVQAIDLAATQGEAVALTSDDLSLRIRRQIKAERQTELTDDVFIAAYQQYQSLREAAAYLSAATGQPISKDKVSRALNRAGGVTEVLNSTDSNSVVRGVASQRRDRKGKNLLQSQPLNEE